MISCSYSTKGLPMSEITCYHGDHFGSMQMLTFAFRHAQLLASPTYCNSSRHQCRICEAFGAPGLCRHQGQYLRDAA